MKARVTFILILCVFVNLKAQDLKSSLNKVVSPSYIKEILTRGKMLDPYNSLPEEMNLLLQGNEEINCSQKWDFKRLSETQDTLYRLDSSIYYKYPSDIDSVYFRKEIPYARPDGSEYFIESSRYDTVLHLWIKESKSSSYYDTAGIDQLIINYQWSKTNQDWRPVRRTDYEVNEYGAPVLRHYQYWDTISNVWITDYRKFYEYDDNRNMILDGMITWSKEENNWISGSKYEYEYNDLNQKIMESRYHYDPYYPKWIGDFKAVMEYNDNNLITRTSFSWINLENDWLPSLKYDYQYDDLNRQTILITGYYDEYLQVWNYNSKNETVYNLTNQIILISQYGWLEESWVIQKQDTTIYIDSGEYKLNIALTRNSEGMPWDSVSRAEYYFDETTGKTEKLQFTYSEDDWLLVEKTITRNDENGSNYYEEYYWDNLLQQLTGNYIMEMLYNDKGLFTGFTFFDWSPETNDWFGEYKISIYYSSSGYTNSEINFLWDIIAADWKIDYKKFNFFSMVDITDTDPLIIQSDEISIYPNPAGTFLNISLPDKSSGISSYQIYSLTGKFISSGRLDEHSTLINVSELQNGMYIIRVGEGSFYTGKIVIQK
jgi:hypothetical protein